MTDGFEAILDIIKDHHRDGYEVPAIEIDLETYRALCADASFITVGDDSFDHDERAELESDPDGDYIGIAAATDIYVNETISEPVAADVRLRDRGDA